MLGVAPWLASGLHWRGHARQAWHGMAWHGGIALQQHAAAHAAAHTRAHQNTTKPHDDDRRRGVQASVAREARTRKVGTDSPCPLSIQVRTAGQRRCAMTGRPFARAWEITRCDLGAVGARHGLRDLLLLLQRTDGPMEGGGRIYEDPEPSTRGCSVLRTYSLPGRPCFARLAMAATVALLVYLSENYGVHTRTDAIPRAQCISQ